MSEDVDESSRSESTHVHDSPTAEEIHSTTSEEKRDPSEERFSVGDVFATKKPGSAKLAATPSLPDDAQRRSKIRRGSMPLDAATGPSATVDSNPVAQAQLSRRTSMPSGIKGASSWGAVRDKILVQPRVARAASLDAMFKLTDPDTIKLLRRRSLAGSTAQVKDYQANLRAQIKRAKELTEVGFSPEKIATKLGIPMSVLQCKVLNKF